MRRAGSSHERVHTMRKAKGKNPAARGAWGRPDPWQTAVYAFEYAWADWRRKTLTLKEVKAGIRRACRLYGLRPPRVGTHPGNAYSWHCDGRISFKRRHMNPAVALHETAHYITDALFGDSPEDHGVAFQGVYFWLLTQAGIAPASALQAGAREHGLKWRLLSPETVRGLQS